MDTSNPPTASPGEDASQKQSSSTGRGFTPTLWISELDFERLSTDKIALGLGLCYLSGYLINVIFARTLGIDEISFVKSQFIETGIVFILFSSSVMFLPVVLIGVISQLRTLEKLDRRAVFLHSIISLNYCLVLLFFALFITENEWEKASGWIWGYSLKNASLIYLGVIIVFLPLTTDAERWFKSFRKRNDEGSSLIHIRRPGAIRMAENLLRKSLAAIRWALLIATLYFDVLVFVAAKWLPDALWKMRFYFILLFIFVYMAYLVHKTYKKTLDVKLRTRLLFTSSIYLLSIFYLVLTSYSFSVYRMIPSSRGGKMPIYQSTITVKGDVAKIYPELIADSTDAYCRTKPVFIIDQNSRYLYVIVSYEPFGGLDFGNTYLLKADDVITVSERPCNLR